jgi:prephenate dehydrogenase
MKRWETVAIIGVGLIGGSIGLTLRRRGLSDRVIGIGRRETSLRKARECEAVTETTTDLEAGVAHADLIVVCTPVTQIVEHVGRAARACPPHALLTDAGSTKASIVEALTSQLGPEVAFVGSHPLAGSEKTGPQAARDDLFLGRVVVITPADQTSKDWVTTIDSFWSSLGASVVRMPAAAHDRAVAATSHLPHLLASALAVSTPDEVLPLVSTGWLDTTRVAGGDPQLWLQILRDNRPAVLKSLGKFAKVLDSFGRALDEDDADRVLELLEVGKQCRDAVGNRHPSGRGTA